MSYPWKDRALTVVMGTLMASFAIAGCMEDSDIDSLPDPGALDAPKWKPGQTWHYVSGEGEWQNWTVEALEQVGNYTTYRISVDLSPPDGFGLSTYIYWYDTETLGAIAVQKGSDQAMYDFPAERLFPMENKSYSINAEVNGEIYAKNGTHFILGWREVNVSGGSFDAVKLQMLDNDFDRIFRTGWYSPTVENYVKWVSYDEEFELSAWAKPDTGS